MDLSTAAVLFDLLLQAPPVAGPSGGDVAVGVGSSAVGSFLSTLIVGAILVAVAPDYTVRLMDAVREDVVGSFVYGLLALGALVAATVLLAITIVGLLVAFPLLLLAVLVWAVGATVGFLTVADRFVDRSDGWLKPLVVAAAINGLLALTGVGGVVSFCVGAAGFGAVLREWL